MIEELDSYLVRITEHKKGKTMQTRYVNTFKEAIKITKSAIIPEVRADNRKKIVRLYWNDGKQITREDYSSYIGDTVFMCVIERKMNG